VANRVFGSDRERQTLRVQHAGATAGEQALAQSVAAGKAVPLALAKGDFDGDGYEDLVVGYSTPAGGAKSFTPDVAIDSREGPRVASRTEP